MNSSLLVTEKPLESTALDATALATLFHEARTANGFLPVPVPHAVLEAIVEASHLGPTAMNATPLRVLFIESADAKDRLLKTLSPGNVEKTKAAPVTAIVGHDLRFYEHLPKLFPHRDMSHIAKDPQAASFSQYNAALQTGYFILAARAFGLDAGPMGGFDKEAVDREFFPDGRIKSDLLVNLGYGDDSKLYPRAPRLEFDDVARYL